MDAHLEGLAPASILVSAGRQPRLPGAGLNAPLEFSSTYVADGPVNYARGGNPTWTAFEEALGALEGGSALVFASGMAAIAAALSLVSEGSVIVAPTHAYSGTGLILASLEKARRIVVRRVDISDADAVIAALKGADLLWAESPTNPMLEVADLPRIFAAAHAVDAIAPQAAIYLTVQFNLHGQKTANGTLLATTKDITKYLLDEAKLAIVPFSAFGASVDSSWYRLSVGTCKLEDVDGVIANLKSVLSKLS